MTPAEVAAVDELRGCMAGNEAELLVKACLARDDYEAALRRLVDADPDTVEQEGAYRQAEAALERHGGGRCQGAAGLRCAFEAGHEGPHLNPDFEASR